MKNISVLVMLHRSHSLTIVIDVALTCSVTLAYQHAIIRASQAPLALAF